MMKNSAMPKMPCGANAVEARAARTLFVRHSSLVIRHSRPALTLIELLVTIVIMVTVLAGVLPLVSPNNNSRKIREGSRQLNTLFSQAQAQAARDGRPVGVAFREFGTGGSFSGVALEAYLIAAPPAYAGFSEHSRAVVQWTGGLVYGTAGGSSNGGTAFGPQYNGMPVCQIQFVSMGSPDAFPPGMLRIGDTIEVAGNRFLICDDADKTQMPNQVQTIGNAEYLHSDPTAAAPTPGTEVYAIWSNYAVGKQLPLLPTTTAPSGQSYKIARQPVNASDAPLQLPRGVAIDMEASGTTGIGGLNPPNTFDALTGVADVVGIMFSPNGSLERVYLNGTSQAGVERIFLLAGLAENGNGNGLDRNDYDFYNNSATDAAEVAARRSRVNWLNPDSRWVSVNRAGRVVTAENYVSYDPTDPAFHNNGTANEQQQAQIGAARQNASNMTGSTGR